MANLTTINNQGGQSLVELVCLLFFVVIVGMVGLITLGFGVGNLWSSIIIP